MACDSVSKKGLTVDARKSEVKEAVKALEDAISTGAVKVVVNANGSISFKGWGEGERRDLTDACTFRILQSQSSWALRQALARAEVTAGRKVDQRVAVGGWHSHDGKTFGNHGGGH